MRRCRVVRSMPSRLAASETLPLQSGENGAQIDLLASILSVVSVVEHRSETGQPIGQVLDFDKPVFAKRRREGDRVVEFPYIAGPAIVEDQQSRRVGKTHGSAGLSVLFQAAGR